MRVLIIGGGIGGMTAGYAMSRAGLDAVVFEQVPDARKIYVGSGLHLWNNAVAALNSIGLGQKIAAAMGPNAVIHRLRMMSHTGRKLAEIPFDDTARKIGADCIGVNRAELLAMVAEEIDDSRKRLGVRCVGYRFDGDDVVALFEDGSEERGDVLVAADGSRSVLRGQLLADGRPSFAGYTIWEGHTEFPYDSAPIGTLPITYGPGKRFAYYRVSESQLYWFAVGNAGEGETDPEGRRKQLLLERFRGWPAPIEEIISVTDESTMGRRDLYYREPEKKWGEGRMTLLGDAAHAMTFDIGQGAAQSIEDAVVLTKCLTSASDPQTALREYERIRMPRTRRLQRISQRVGRIGRWSNPAAVRARELIMRMTFGNPLFLKKFEQDLIVDFD
jgi:2-polyprenyl-6-methoxyphenol hydroxylase-like FAD-dependent oxidoreductase